MQAWQINALKLEVSLLDDLTVFIRENALYFLLGIIGLMVVLLAWVVSGGLRGGFKQLPGTVHPVIVIRLPGPPPAQPDDFNPFPPPHYTEYDYDGDWD